MIVTLHGGFGEKGRTSVGVETGNTSLLLDVGVNTSGSGADIYPRISQGQLRRQSAIVVSHAHEDHVGALGWCLANGFAGQVFMTAETEAEMRDIVAAYDAASGRAALAISGIQIIAPGQSFTVGDAIIASGRSGHTVGGIWLSVSDRRHRVIYCADVVPGSGVLGMDPLPPCDAILFDGSYGVDPVGMNERTAQIKAWLREHPGGCLLPTPLAGRSLELLGALSEPAAIHASMRQPLLRQIADESWLRPGIGALLRERILAAEDWTDNMPFPQRPILVHDGMGIAGPAAVAIGRAARERLPILLTGHLPTGSPAQILFAAGRAAWIRLPTHPTLPDNLALLGACGARIAVPHSCSPDEMEQFRGQFPAVVRTLVTGQSFSLQGR